MAKTRWSVLTALVLVALTAAIFTGRRLTLGAEAGGPPGASIWKVTLAATGELPANETLLATARPPDFRHQYIFDERFNSKDLRYPTGKKSSTHVERREVVWRRISMSGRQPFRLTYSFRCVMGRRRPTPAMIHLTHELDGPPADGASLKASPHIQSDHAEISRQAAEWVDDEAAPLVKVKALFDHVADDLENEPTLESQSALECLRNNGGNSGGKSRLLVALCRNRGIPARLVSGLILVGDQEQNLHYWAEAWVTDHWVPMCPTHHHFDVRKFPKNYLVLEIGEEEPVRGRGVRPQYGFVVQALQDANDPNEEQPPSAARQFWLRLSFYTLRPAEQHLVKFLLLLPLSALLVSIYRTLVGIPTFGTFSPALLGLAFLDLSALPWGLSIFVLTVLVGWILRRLLDRYHLLLVPRTAILLTLIVLFLIAVIVTASHYGIAVTHYISLFPLVILTHLVERFWTVETEDGTVASFKTLLGTLVVAVTISLALSPEAVSAWMFRHPETLGVVLAAQFLIGRYTGYRISELYRFRDLIEEDKPPEKSA